MFSAIGSKEGSRVPVREEAVRKGRPYRELILALCLTVPFWSLGHRLVEVDDARYAEIPREMAASGDWVAPTLNGLPYVEKPPLLYWLCAASYSVFGVSETAARLPLALLALLGLAGVWWLGSWLIGPGAGLVAVASLATGGLFTLLTRMLTPDLPLAVFLLWSMALALRALMRPADARWAAPLAWLCAALAVLSKGLVGLLFPAGWVILLCGFEPELRPRLRALARPAGPLLFLAVAAPWFVLMERAHPGFFAFFFGEQHFQRFLTPKFARTQPWYFFVLLLPAALLPWTPAVFAGARQRSLPSRALALWVGMVVVFFSLSSSKLATYLAPVLPQAALLAALGLEGRTPRWRWLAPVFALALPAAFLAPAPAAAAVILAALAAAFWLEPTVERLTLAGLALSAALAAGLPSAAPSAKDLGLYLKRRAGPEDKIWTYGAYLHGLPWYMGRSVDRMMNWTGELYYAKRDSRYAPRFGRDEEMWDLPLSGGKVFVVYRTFEAPHMAKLVFPGELKDSRTFGAWTVGEVPPVRAR